MSSAVKSSIQRAADGKLRAGAGSDCVASHRCPIPLGVGGSRLPGPRGNHSKSHRSAGAWRVGAVRPTSSWLSTIGWSSVFRGSRRPGARMSWKGRSWSLLVGRQASLRLLRSWKLPPRTVQLAGRASRCRVLVSRINTIIIAIAALAVLLGVMLALNRYRLCGSANRGTERAHRR